MTLQFNNCTSDNNKLDKSYTVLYTLTDDNLYYDTSKIDTVIHNIDAHFDEITAKKLMSDCNYLHVRIDDTHIYYYVRQITFNMGFADITLHKDVLMTYADDIRRLNAIIDRNEHRFNMYLQDDIYKSYAYPQIQVREFPSGFSDTRQSIILNVAGK